tara:strand:+ start:13 stop:684 length:672 start_codon:yes stop_codon:yes gene_type:complete
LKNLTLIIPAKNEAESLPKFLEELKNFDTNIIIVLPKEDLATQNSIKDFNSNIKILFQEQDGYGSAIIEGLLNSKTEYSCIINADGSMDPKYLNSMLENCVTKDFIFASRYEKLGGGSDDDTIITLIGNKIFSFLGNAIFDLKISDILYTYVLGKTDSFKKLQLNHRDFRLCVELPIKAKKKGLKYSNVPSFERTRIAGTKKVNALIDGFLILFGILSFIGKK